MFLVHILSTDGWLLLLFASFSSILYQTESSFLLNGGSIFSIWPAGPGCCLCCTTARKQSWSRADGEESTCLGTWQGQDCYRVMPAQRHGFPWVTRWCGPWQTSIPKFQRSAPSSIGCFSSTRTIIPLTLTIFLATSSSCSSMLSTSLCLKGDPIELYYVSEWNVQIFQALESAPCLSSSVVLSSLCDLQFCLYWGRWNKSRWSTVYLLNIRLESASSLHCHNLGSFTCASFYPWPLHTSIQVCSY